MLRHAPVAAERAERDAAWAWSAAFWAASTFCWAAWTAAESTAGPERPDDGSAGPALPAAGSCPASASARVSRAAASAACAWVMRARSSVRSSWARVCPALTCWPTVTSTEATVPDWANPTAADCSAVMVPTRSRPDVTDPRATAAVR